MPQVSEIKRCVPEGLFALCELALIAMEARGKHGNEVEKAEVSGEVPDSGLRETDADTRPVPDVSPDSRPSRQGRKGHRRSVGRAGLLAAEATGRTGKRVRKASRNAAQ